MQTGLNSVRLCGNPTAAPEFSHMGRDEEYYKFPLRVERLSGAEDTLNIVISKKLLDTLEITENARMRVTGEVRSYNNKTGKGSRLVITVLAREIEFCDDSFENRVELRGVFCKTPNLRKTPMGREICDLMLAVNRKYGRSDYLPCIAWGNLAKEAALWPVGTEVSITGRLQSRDYIKTENGETVTKTAFEISAVTCEKIG